ncbi:type II toxin-antitoxin system RelE/ParE family toxin [Sphingomonas sp. KR1UV-12]|uniref:Type II toxin-antitoxin system RelE/ParE family toxin n=1 Tax=Sphingomonas aurea TaxID=3063994 RepID=A0ABT9EIK1_9SPHN|nr:type II toxin-antitoxin system RelE/ParE family toxin [Sphingomonas sp. KR1UV-12]MDP1026793.1 type II toxin-antitoxin system RelE/ParE family toxin [Sphingomonas sp. KR1UV-12]
MIIRLTNKAQADLIAIGDHIAGYDPDRAAGLVRALRAKCLSLAELPRGYPLVPRFEAFGIRRRVHGNYLIFYRLDDDQVVVLHVLHGARDYAGLLGPE